MFSPLQRIHQLPVLGSNGLKLTGKACSMLTCFCDILLSLGGN